MQIIIYLHSDYTTLNALQLTAFFLLYLYINELQEKNTIHNTCINNNFYIIFNCIYTNGEGRKFDA